jgi:hypothetical protein
MIVMVARYNKFANEITYSPTRPSPRRMVYYESTRRFKTQRTEKTR